MHGIYGSGRNWRTVARRVVRARPDWGALLVDLRQHGASRDLDFPPPHTLAAAAGDVQRMIDVTGLPVRGLLGHSFGGKVAMLHARDQGYPDRRPDERRLETLWAVDSSPAARPPGGSAWEMLAALRSTPGPFPDREAGVRALAARGVAEPVARWMALNLERSGDEPGERHTTSDGRQPEWRWHLDPAALEDMLDDFFRTDLWSVIDAPPAGLAVHVVKARESSMLDEAACAHVEEAGDRSGRVHLHRVGGGHWVNTDAPDALVALLKAHLP